MPKSLSLSALFYVLIFSIVILYAQVYLYYALLLQFACYILHNDILTNTIFDVTSSPCCSSQPDKGALVRTTFFSLRLCSSMEKVYIYRRNS